MSRKRAAGKRKAYVPALLLAFVLGLWSCNSDSDPSPAEKPQATQGTQSTAPEQNGTENDTGEGTSKDAIFINHTTTDLDAIPDEWIVKARQTLHIAYGFTSHGSQITGGMAGLKALKGSAYAYAAGGTGGALDLRPQPFPEARDLGDPDRTAWQEATKAYLDAHPEINVVMWSWCGQVDTTSENIDLYLDLMNELEQEYPGVRFVYMTGHLDGTGVAGNVHLRNEQIRKFCAAHGKALYDFADIETYDPDGISYLGRLANDACEYDSNGDGVRDDNWAVAWQSSHAEGVDWYACSSPHTEPLNANLKAYAAWWLWARLAGWSGKQ